MLSVLQQDCLTAIEREPLAAGWGAPCLMAFCEIESSFRPNAYRFEPRLNEASYGVMQLLLSTARMMGFNDHAADLYNVANNIHYGCKYLTHIAQYLYDNLGYGASMPQIAAAYNMGEAGVLRHLRQYGEDTCPDPAYVDKWNAAFSKWSQELGAS